VIKTQSLRGSDGMLYWFETPEGLDAQGRCAGWSGHSRPVQTAAEMDENQRLVPLGPECKVTEGGEWNPVRGMPKSWPTGPRSLQ
jgi:hypothetical protein